MIQMNTCPNTGPIFSLCTLQNETRICSNELAKNGRLNNPDKIFSSYYFPLLVPPVLNPSSLPAYIHEERISSIIIYTKFIMIGDICGFFLSSVSHLTL